MRPPLACHEGHLERNKFFSAPPARLPAPSLPNSCAFDSSALIPLRFGICPGGALLQSRARCQPHECHKFVATAVFRKQIRDLKVRQGSRQKAIDKRLFKHFSSQFLLTTAITLAEYCRARSRPCCVNANSTGQAISSFCVYAFGREGHRCVHAGFGPSESKPPARR